jgi:hypothetical protein
VRVLGETSTAKGGVVIMIHRTGRVAAVRFQPFSESGLQEIKHIKGRQWLDEEKLWQVPVEAVDGLARKLHQAGEGVLIDGKAFDPIRAAQDTNPFIPLFVALPERLRSPVFGSLVSVLGPDLGGDAELFAQLCAAHGLVDAPRRARQADLRKARKGRITTRPVEERPIRRLVRRSA